MGHIMLVTAILAGLFISNTAPADDDVKLEIGNMLRAAEMKYDLPEGILSAIAHVESSTNPKAFVRADGKSGKASHGLLQIQLDTARTVQALKAKQDGIKVTKKTRITSKQLMGAETNIDYGAFYLKWIMNNHKNDVAWSVSCFNAGVNSFICKNKKYSPYAGLVLNAMLYNRGNE